MATIEDLQRELSQKDAMIISMKDKTKEFVEKLKSDHLEELKALELRIHENNKVSNVLKLWLLL